MILFLEDNPDLRRYTIEWLNEDGFKKVKGCGRTDQATEYLKENLHVVTCIIVDLNMNDQWLGKYREESNGAFFSGWVWLRRFVWKELGLEHIPCVIYSGYNDFFFEYLSRPSNKEQNDIMTQKMQERLLFFVNKGSGKGEGYEGLIQTLKRIQAQRGDLT